MLDAIGEAARQLEEPDLPDGLPPTIGCATQEFLVAPAGAVDTILHAQQVAPPAAGATSIVIERIMA